MRGRYRDHEDSSQMGGLLAPDVRAPLPQNYHRQNMLALQQKQELMQRKALEDKVAEGNAQDHWKMRRFQSVESKVANQMGARTDLQRNPSAQGMMQQQPSVGQTNQTPTGLMEQKPMNKAQQMKLRMQKEREGQLMNQNNLGNQTPQQQDPVQMESNKENAVAAVAVTSDEPYSNQIEMEKPVAKKAPLAPKRAQVQEESIFALANKQAPNEFEMPNKKPPISSAKPPMASSNAQQQAGPTQKPASSQENKRPARRVGSLGAAGRQIMSQGSQKGLASVDNSALKDAVPKSNDLVSLKGQKDRNFIKENLNKVVFEEAVQKKKTGEAIPVQNKSYGKVPKYLQKFNDARAEKERQKELAIENAKIPAGTRLMPEEERQETLADLKLAHKETRNQLETLPIAVKSQRMENHKKELEQKLNRLEKAVETFSKEKVYVQF